MRGFLMFLSVVLLATGCGKETAPGPAAGAERGPCYGNGTCDEGLTCLSDLCVVVPDQGPDAGDQADIADAPETDAPDGGDVPSQPDADPMDTTDTGDTAEPVDADEPGDTGDTGRPDDADDMGAPDARADLGDTGDERFADLISRATFNQMFLHKDDPACEGGLYTYDNLVAAAEAYPEFARTGSAEVRKREVAAFLGNISHETTGGWSTAPDGPQTWGLCFVQEVGCGNGGCTGYCDVNNRDYPCAQGRTYHGRGAMQLSWNYNYGLAGQELGEDLLANPDQVSSDGRLAFLTALWFWMRPQAPKPSAHDVMTGGWVPDDQDIAAGRLAGFGATINIINGGLECNQPTDHRVEDRVLFFRRYSELLGVDPGPNLYCDQMQAF